MNEFFQRLKQRKLVQWAIAYVAAAFALLQGIDIVAQQFGWPEGVRRGITLALVVGFVLTLVLAWYHGERGTQVLHFRRAFHGRSGYTMSLTNTDPRKTDLFAKFDWPRVSCPS